MLMTVNMEVAPSHSDLAHACSVLRPDPAGEAPRGSNRHRRGTTMPEWELQPSRRGAELNRRGGDRRQQAGLRRGWKRPPRRQV